MTEFAQESQKLSTDPVVEMFDFDATSIGGGIYYFYSGGTQDVTLIWRGNRYVPIPLMAEGWEFSGKGSLPTPTFKISNVALLMSSIINDIGDPLSATITRWKTFKRFLDGEADADPDKHFTKEIFQVERKTNQNDEFVEFELSAAIDQDGRKLPSRQVVRSFCSHRYRIYKPESGTFDYSNATCPYAGSDDTEGGTESPYFDQSGNPTGDPSADSCGKKLSDCRLRFEPLGLPLPFRGFPGVGRIKRQ